MKLRKRDLFLLVAAPALMLGAIGTVGGIQANSAANEVYAEAITNTETLAYSGSSTVNMNGQDQAETLGLSSEFTVVGVKNGPNNNIGLNQSGEIRLYGVSGRNGNALVVTAKTATITSITVNWKSSGGAKVLVDGEEVTQADNAYAINAASFTIKNANNSTTQVKINSISITYTKTVTAKNYTATFKDGDTTVGTQEVASGGKLTKIEENDSFKKDGYFLNGWTKDDKWREEWAFATDTISEDITLYADWVKNDAEFCTLTFVLDGGNGSYEEQIVYEDHYFKTVENPTKDSDDLYSYTFAGWYEKDNDNNYLTEPFNFDKPATKDVELYAKWDEEYVIQSESFFTGNKTLANIAFGYTSTATSTATISEWTASSNSVLDPDENHDLGNGVTLSYNGGSGSSTEVRLYKNKTLTISSEEEITKIEMTCTAQNTSEYGPGCASVDVGDWTYKGYVGTWTGSAKTINILAETKQVRFTSLKITMGEDNTTYSNFENAKLQFHYDFSELEQSQKDKIKKATEMGLFVTDDKNFFKTGSADSLTVGEGQIGKKYEKVAEKEYELTVGIAVPEAKYKTNLYAAAYLKMPNGKYYFNTKENYSVYGILKDYTKKQSLSITEKAVCQAFADYIDTLTLA